MALSSTSDLVVTKVIHTSSGSGKLTFLLTPVAPFWIGTLVITRSTTTHMSGSFTVGTDANKHVGKAVISVDKQAFADIASQAVVPFDVVLGYDTVTFNIVELDLVRDLTVLSRTLADAVAAAIRSASEPAQAAE